MAKAHTELKFTYSDYEKLPANGKQYQVLDGELFMTPAPLTKHQKVLLKIYDCIKDYIRKNDSGELYISPCDVVLSDENIVQPDLLFIAKGKVHIIKEKNIQGAPDFVVEILSEGTEKLDRIYKKSLYEKFGVKEYWLVDIQDDTVEVLCLKEGRYVSSGVFSKRYNVISEMFPSLDANARTFFENIEG